VRNNQGGSEISDNNLVRYFIYRKTANKIIKLKNGSGHDDFTSFTNYIEPGQKTREYDKIVVLANRVTFSAGNDFVNNFSLLENVTIFGDTTGGGGSTPYIYELANGWRLRYASNIQLRASDSLMIDKGIPPDIYVEMKKSATKDNVLDAALEFLRN
jgi:C-terminal processing protease CtpA/Prc